MIQNVPRGPSKGKALGLAVCFSALTLLLFYFNSLASATDAGCFGCLGFISLLVALVYGWIWFSKVSRDQVITDNALNRRIVDPGEFGVPAPKTTPGSERIFLPDGPPES